MATEEILRLNQRLLETVAAGDWAAYSQLCDPSLSAFEPEAVGNLVEGMDFHKYYFDLPKSNVPKNTTMVRPHVRIMGDVAVVSYIRLVQCVDANGAPQTGKSEETRIWQRQQDSWKHVHFHRSV